MKAIETRYAGCRFRSRLEARWAVFFEELEVPWEYEPEGFETAAGPYLPDFRLGLVFGPGITWTWFEVKPDDAPEDPRHAAFVAGGEFLTVARGLPRGYADQWARLVTLDPPGTRWAGETKPVGFYAFRDGEVTTFGEGGTRFTGDRAAHAVDRALTAARSARFEHGETPAARR